MSDELKSPRTTHLLYIGLSDHDMLILILIDLRAPEDRAIPAIPASLNPAHNVRADTSIDTCICVVYLVLVALPGMYRLHHRRVADRVRRYVQFPR